MGRSTVCRSRRSVLDMCRAGGPRQPRPMALQSASRSEGAVVGESVLFNPATYDGEGLDPEAKRLMLATIEFFESRGKGVLKEHDREHIWYADFLEFVKENRVF